MNYRLLKGLQKFEDLELSAIVFNEGKVADEYRKLGVKVTITDETHLNFFKVLKCARKYIYDSCPDIVHSHRMKENILAYLSSKSMKNIKLVCTQHGLPEPLDEKLKYTRRMLLMKYHIRVLSKYFSKVVVVSSDVRDFFVDKYKMGNNQVEMIHNGTEIPVAKGSKKGKNFFLIGSAGRLFPVKNYTFMVEVAREVLKRAKDVRFELAGEGPEKEKIISAIQENGMKDSFFLVGFVDDISEFYESLDLYLNTSKHEGLPMSILEAMGYGIPVVAPNLGGMKEIIKNDLHGYLVDGNDPRKYADACISLYENRDLLEKMGIASKIRVENGFSYDLMASKYHELYRNICQSDCS